MSKRTTLALAMLLPLLATACGPVLVLGAASAAGTGAIVWYRGWVEQTIAEPQDRVFRAGRAALADLKIVLVDDELDGESGVLEGYAEDSKRVMVKTKALAEKSTRVRIRVGFWGDQQRSLRILEQLKKHL